MSKVSRKNILKKLDNYVDSFLEEETPVQKPKKKKVTKRNVELEEFEKKYSLESDEGQKTENKNDKIDIITDINKIEKQKTKVKGQKRHLEFIKGFLDLKTDEGTSEGQLEQESSSDDEGGDFGSDMKTDGALQKSAQQNHKPIEVIEFEDQRSKKRKLKASSDEPGEEATGVEASIKFNMRKARHDVQKFGIKGFEKKEKKKAEAALAIKLGARPPRKNHVPYKTFMEQQQQKKDEEKKKREMDKLMGLKVRSRKGMKKPKLKGDLGFIDGQVGRYRGGVQTLTKDQVEKIKKTRVKRN